ncbi:MAG: hypothetical protein Q7K57_61235 [Burkholderiaceae bacterium]|nr:hypothetical protein [Burkholderiaceae bacterium]
MNKLIWGQLVQITDETHPCFGRVGQYEGVISANLDALRVRFPGGVIVAKHHQLCATSEHPVCTARRLKAKGLRAPRPVSRVTPKCYFKDYGKTEQELAFDAWLDAPDDASCEETERLCDEAFRINRKDLIREITLRRQMAKRKKLARRQP